MAKSAWVFDVTEADFEEKVIKKSHDTPVVVDFWAPWCGPCKSLGPILEGMIDKRGGSVLLAKVNTDDEQNLAMQFDISGIPHVVAFRKGKAFLQFTGLLPQGQLDDFFNRLVPTEAEKKLDSAVDIEKTNPAEAETIYRNAIKENADREDAIVGLARVLLEQNKLAEVADLLERVGPHAEHGPEAERLRAILWLREKANELPTEDSLRAKVKTAAQDASALCDLGIWLAANGRYPEALETLFQAGSFDRKLVATRVKETMVKIFFVVGVRSDLADAYRDKLTSLLY